MCDAKESPEQKRKVGPLSFPPPPKMVTTIRIVTTEARRRKIISLVAEPTTLLRAVIFWQNFVPCAKTKVQEYTEPYFYTITPAELFKIS